jgi:hypothetical protein
MEVVDEVNYGIERFVAGMERVSADKLGLDIRAGRVYIDRDERVIVSDNPRSLEYYGGFEYIDKECKTQIGDYTIYMECDRVADCFDCLEDEVEEEDAE